MLRDKFYSVTSFAKGQILPRDEFFLLRDKFCQGAKFAKGQLLLKDNFFRDKFC